MIVFVSCFLWIVFFVTHSLFADNIVREKLLFRLKWSERKYRFFYSLMSTLLLGSVYVFQFLAAKNWLMEVKNFTLLLGVFLMLVGVYFNYLAFKNISVKVFIGLATKKEKEETILIQNGIYTVVRHPIYTGLISIYIGFFLIQPSLYNALNFGLILSYLPIGIYLEERKLIKYFGSSYIEYRKKVRRLFLL
ncbi:MAG: isoprenylcysteine carboxylmethyltransferase family protein [Flavobacteriales bacterium]|nr:isoprenylcysteine carboxylmethyltransferase family protein [Flavobacteriales bacterium]